MIISILTSKFANILISSILDGIGYNWMYTSSIAKIGSILEVIMKKWMYIGSIPWMYPHSIQSAGYISEVWLVLVSLLAVFIKMDV